MRAGVRGLGILDPPDRGSAISSDGSRRGSSEGYARALGGGHAGGQRGGCATSALAAHQSLAPALEEEALARQPEQLCGLVDAAAGRAEGMFDELLLEVVDRAGERLIEADGDLRARRVGGHRGPRVPVADDLRGEVGGAEQGAVGGQGREAADFVGELADVAGPVVEQERGDQVVAQPQAAAAALAGEARQEQRRQGRDLVLALAQRRQRDFGDAEAIEEVAPEPALVGEALQVGVGGGDDADGDALGAQVADRLDLAALEEPQQLGLGRQVEVADLVQEQRPALGSANDAGSRSPRRFNFPASVRPRD